MRNNILADAIVMAASLILVIAITFIICTANLGETVQRILLFADVVLAVIFTICPALITKAAGK